MGCTADAITISVEQAKFARERVMAEGLDGRVRIHLLDYRELPPEFESAFDACLSTEMLEVNSYDYSRVLLLIIGFHQCVGHRYMKTYLRVVDWVLKDDRATAVLTGATYPETTFSLNQLSS